MTKKIFGITVVLFVTTVLTWGSSGDVSEILGELKKQCMHENLMMSPNTMGDIEKLKRRLVVEVIKNSKTQAVVKNELLGSMKKSDAAEPSGGKALYVSCLMRIIAKSSTPSEFIDFCNNVLLSKKYAETMRVDLLRFLGYQLRGVPFFREKQVYDDQELKNLLIKIAQLEEPELRSVAIKLLTGWSIDGINVKPIALEDGINILRKLADEKKVFSGKHPYLKQLAKLGYQRKRYVEQLRKQVDDSNLPLYIRLEYAKEILEWDAQVVGEITAKLQQKRK